MCTAASGCWTTCWRAWAGRWRAAACSQIYHFVAAEALRQGKLVEVMTPLRAIPPFYALYPQHRHLSARVRAFVDYLLAAVRPRQDPSLFK